jgi:hypothetical protein
MTKLYHTNFNLLSGRGTLTIRLGQICGALTPIRESNQMFISANLPIRFESVTESAIHRVGIKRWNIRRHFHFENQFLKDNFITGLRHESRFWRFRRITLAHYKKRRWPNPGKTSNLKLGFIALSQKQVIRLSLNTCCGQQDRGTNHEFGSKTIHS